MRWGAVAAQEPCRSFVLRNVICSYCNDCTDLDLCRDPMLQARSSHPFLTHDHPLLMHCCVQMMSQTLQRHNPMWLFPPLHGQPGMHIPS